MGRAVRRALVYASVLLVLVVIGAVAAFNLDAFGAKSTMIRTAVGAQMRLAPPIPVTVVEAKVEQWPQRIAAIGTLEAIRGVNVAPQVAGRIVSIHFEPGARVKAGDLLVKLDTTVEEAELQEARAQLNLAALNLQRTSDLAERGNAPQANLDRSRAERDVAQARAERIQANIALKNIKAPFDGQLGLRQVNLGQYLAVGTAMVWIQALDPIYLNFAVPERELPRLKAGQRVTLRVDGLRDGRFEGAISTVDTRIDQNTRNVTVQATVPNPQGQLVPGQFAEVRVRLGEDMARVTVPQTAVSYSLYGDSVYIVAFVRSADGKPVMNPDGNIALTVERRFVRLGEKRDADVAVLEGVKAGERVVTSGQIRLLPNARVSIATGIDAVPPADRPRP